MRIGRWSKLSVDSVCQEHEVMRDGDANETRFSIWTCSPTGLSQLRISYSDPLLESAIFLPLISVDLEYHDGWYALKSPRIRVSGVVRRCSIEE